jgi:hypothetical protein
LDTTPELDEEAMCFYQSQVGMLHWMVELGHINIITKLSKLALYMMMLHKGHLDALLHMFAYLKSKHNARLVLDPTYPTIDLSKFIECDWKHFYGDMKEPIPPHAPQPRGKEVQFQFFVDGDHAGDRLTRCSCTGFVIFLNMAPIMWYSKQQPTIETSVFGAEFVVMKIGVKTVRGLHYKLRMMGVALTGPAYVYGDNMLVIHNTQRPESTLKKKSNVICYHAVRESVAMGECITGHVASVDNPADIATKVIPGGQNRSHLIRLLLYDLADFD